MKRHCPTVAWVVVLLAVCVSSVSAQSDNNPTPNMPHGTAILDDGTIIGFAKQSAPTTLQAADYDWWHGCSPTSAGMMMGYYDRNGYSGYCYRDVVPGGVAEENSFGGGGSSLRCNNTIASTGHIADFWVSYGHAGPDPLASGRTIPDDFDCLADFMGTSQASQGNVDAETIFWFRSNGNKTTPGNIESWGKVGNDGMYGVKQYVEYTGYDHVSNGIYTQLTDNDLFGYGFGGGFTYEAFKAEIDAGRPMMVHVLGHSMLGYGYEDTGTLDRIHVYDTWNPNGQNPGYMEWGGSYGTRGLWGVTALTLDTTGIERFIDGGSGTVAYDDDGFATGGSSGSTAGLPDNALYLDATMTVDDFHDGGDGVATLKFFYSDEELVTKSITDESMLRMYWWNGNAWNSDGAGAFHDGAPQGGLGDYGVDSANNFAWINVNHGSQWGIAAVPEPSTLFLAVCALSLVFYRPDCHIRFPD